MTFNSSMFYSHSSSNNGSSFEYLGFPDGSSVKQGSGPSVLGVIREVPAIAKGGQTAALWLRSWDGTIAGVMAADCAASGLDSEGVRATKQAEVDAYLS